MNMVPDICHWDSLAGTGNFIQLFQRILVSWQGPLLAISVSLLASAGRLDNCRPVILLHPGRMPGTFDSMAFSSIFFSVLCICKSPCQIPVHCCRLLNITSVLVVVQTALTLLQEFRHGQVSSLAEPQADVLPGTYHWRTRNSSCHLRCLPASTYWFHLTPMLFEDPV